MSRGAATVEITITPAERELLRRPVVSSGGLQAHMHRLQRGLRGHTLTLTVDDLGKLANYYRYDPHGGYQKRYPLASLRAHLPTVAPLFRAVDGPVAAPLKRRWIYFVQDGQHRIKIGVTSNRTKRGGGLRTDNADRLVLLLMLAETEAVTERDLQRRFAHLRIRPEQEWFWPGEDLLGFIATAERLERRA